MAISAQVYVEHPDLALAPTIRSLADVEIRVISDAGTDPDHDVYFFWVEGPDFDAIEAALADDHTVADFSVIIENENEARRAYRIEYSPQAKLISPPVTEVGAVTLESESHLNGWRLELQLQNHDGLYALDEYAAEEGMKFDVLELHQTGATPDRSDFGLTGLQRETLVAAYVHGYYDEPRETFLEDLAELLDVSPTAVSGRLRRGSARLVEEVLLDDDPD